MIRKSTILSSFLVLALVTILASPVCTTESVINRAHRMLYEIKQSADVKAFCGDEGINVDDLNIDYDKRAQLRTKIDGRYSSIVATFNNGLSFNSQAMGDSAREMFTKSGFGVGIVFLVVIILTFVGFLGWSLLECCFPFICVSRRRAGIEGPRCSKVCFWCAMVFGVVVIVLIIVWSVYIGRLTSRAPEVKCAAAILYSDIVFGVKLSETRTYIGLNGLIDALDNFIVALDGINETKTNANSASLALGDLKAETTSMTDGFTNLKNNDYNKANYLYPNAQVIVSPSNTVPVVFGQVLKNDLIDNAIKKEVDTLQNAGKSIVQALDGLNNFQTSEVDNAKASINSTKSQIRDNIKAEVDNVYNTAFKADTDYFKQVKELGRIVMIVIIVIGLALTVIFLGIQLVTGVFKKATWLRHCNKLIMLILLILGFIILLYSSVMVVANISFAYICDNINNGITVKNWQPISGGSTQIRAMINSCVYKDGDGDLLKALGIDVNGLNKLTDISNNLREFKPLLANFTSMNAPVVGQQIDDQIERLKNYRAVDVKDNPPTDDINAAIVAFNNLNCQQDKINVLGSMCSAGSTQSTSSDASNANVGSNYCIVLEDYKHGDFSTDRYTAGQCGGEEVKANGILKNIGGMTLLAGRLTTVYGNLKSDYETLFYNAELAYFNKIKGGANDIQTIVNKLEKAIETLNQVAGDFSASADCKVFNKEVRLFENIACFRIYTDSYYQSNIGIALGIIMYCFAWCMCCGIRMSTAAKHNVREHDYVQPSEQNPNNQISQRANPESNVVKMD
jgi:hypothetical protein